MIIWQKPNGELAVTSIFDGSDPAEHAALLQERGDVPAAWLIAATGDQAFPQDWPHQQDWRFVGGAIVVDLVCAKETTRARLRAQRVPLLAELDIQFQRALEEGEATGPIVAEKQRLRDITELVEPCEALSELAALSC